MDMQPDMKHGAATAITMIFRFIRSNTTLEATGWAPHQGPRVAHYRHGMAAHYATATASDTIQLDHRMCS